MVSNRKFYKTVIQVTVLSEEPFHDWGSLTDLDYDITDGEQVGDVDEISHDIIDGKQAADMLYAMRSAPGFFRLDADGNDCDY